MTAKDSLFRLFTTTHRAVLKASNGRIASKGLGMPMVILTTTGRTTGKPRQTVLSTPLQQGDTVMLVASYGGDDREPSWCKNLRANPDVVLEIGGRQRAMRAHVADSTERADLWPKITSAHANYAGYQTKTDREIPVVVLEPAGPA
jgi:deazaflavin-dependent oxidoreductase (nitroreductase family)